MLVVGMRRKKAIHTLLLKCVLLGNEIILICVDETYRMGILVLISSFIFLLFPSNDTHRGKLPYNTLVLML